jgi:hypothetical protein
MQIGLELLEVYVYVVIVMMMIVCELHNAINNSNLSRIKTILVAHCDSICNVQFKHHVKQDETASITWKTLFVKNLHVYNLFLKLYIPRNSQIVMKAI